MWVGRRASLVDVFLEGKLFVAAGTDYSKVGWLVVEWSAAVPGEEFLGRPKI